MNDKYGKYGAQAEQFYVHGKTLAEIRQITGVSEVSLSRWKAEYGWDEKRKRYRATGAGSALVLEDAINQILIRIENDGLSDGDADDVAKLGRVLRDLKKSDDIYAMTTIVMDKFIDYVNERYNSGDELDKTAKEIISQTVGGFFKFIERQK